jgi:MraZ protein
MLSHFCPNGGGWTGKQAAVFLSTSERQLDSKRRLVLPADFRAAAAGEFNGVYCFPSLDCGCIEGGGQAFRDDYVKIINGFPRGHPTRRAIETVVLGQMVQLAFDPAGRITLPEGLCQRYGLTDWVSIVGLGDYFQIWPRAELAAHLERQAPIAQQGLTQWAEQSLAASMAGAAGVAMGAAA